MSRDRSFLINALLYRCKQRMNRKWSLSKKRRLLAQHYKRMSDSNVSLLLKAVTIYKPPIRRFWRLRRNKGFWQNVLNNFSSKRWIEAFRVPRNLFFELVAKLENEVSPRQNIISSNEGASAAEKVAVTLYKLASCGEYRVVGDVFGIHKSTVHKYFYEVVTAIHKTLFKTIKMPNEDECRSIASQFHIKSNIPQIIGCIDGTHIPILAPSDGRRDFVNRKGWTSLQMQAVVDNNILFRNISCKYPGSVHDAHAFKGSSLFENNMRFICQEKRNINGSDVPYIIIGDPAYPLLPWLIKDYSGTGLPEERELFNNCLNQSRVNVEIAFGRLKGRWRMLSKRSDIDYLFMPTVIAACCVLHNFIEENNGGFISRWLEDIENDEEVQRFYEQPGLHIGMRDSLSGSEIRDILCNYCCSNIN